MSKNNLFRNVNSTVCKSENAEVSLENYSVSMVSKTKVDCFKCLWVKVEDLLSMTPGKEISSEDGSVTFSMSDLYTDLKALDTVIVLNTATSVQKRYRGFYKFRQNIRNSLCENNVLRQQVEELNKKIAFVGLQTYKAYFDSIQTDSRKFFTRYFFDRFPQESIRCFGGNIGEMFSYYSDLFLLPGLPYYKTKEKVLSFRTRYKCVPSGFGYDYYESYIHPIVDYYNEVKYPTYMAKAIVCTAKEMGLPLPNKIIIA